MFLRINVPVLFLFIQFCSFNICQSYYTIYAPGTLKSNRKYTVCVTLHNASEPAVVKVEISSQSSWRKVQQVSLQPYETKMLDFFPPLLNRTTRYELVATSINDLHLRTSLFVLGAYTSLKVYIETDKGKYKPGDLMRFRIIILDENAKPKKIIEPIKVQILDSSTHRVKQLKDIRLIDGVYTGEFQLSKEPVLGIWTIKVIIGGKYNLEKAVNFAVEKYTLPKFSTHIQTDPHFVIADRFIKINVFAKYTYGKYVEGTAYLKIDLNYMTLFNEQVNMENFLANFEIDYYSLIPDDSLKTMDHLLRVTAIVEEKQTKVSHISDFVINVKKQRYKVSIPEEKIQFHNNVPYLIKAKVEHWNGTLVNDQQTPVFMDYGNKTYESKLDSNGLAAFEYSYEEYSTYTFRYKDSIGKQNNFVFYKNNNKNENLPQTQCSLYLKKKRIQINSNIEVVVDFHEDVQYFIYTLVAHGNVIKNELIRFESNQNSSIIQVMGGNEIMPISFIFVHYIVDGYFKFCELQINLPEEMENKLSIISVPEIAEPGKNITMKIKTQQNSRIYITAVDLSTNILDSGNKIRKKDILRDMRDETSYSMQIDPHLLSGLVVLFSAHYDYPKSEGSQIAPKSISNHIAAVYFSTEEVSVSVRSLFPETWIFQDVEATNEITTINLKVPDTVTTWVITAFSVNEKTGLGILDPSVEMRVFKNFFISTYLPYSIKHSEIVAIPAVIFNYYSEELRTDVVMENTLREFKFIDNISNRTLDSLMEKREIIVPPNSGRQVLFHIHPLKAGLIDINLKAKNMLDTDGVLQKLKVEFDGVAEFQNNDLYVTLKNGESFSTFYKANIPLNVVADSEFLQLSISGNVLLPSLENIDDLVDKPKGCGEQNMINFAPNILVLDYLRATHQTSKYSLLVTKAKKYIEIGYQQELKFRHINGGFSVFGPDISKTPSNWLTAYVVRFFIKAIKYLPIERDLIEGSLNFLASQQLDNGEFIQAGYLFHPSHQNSYGFTAFVLLSFQENAKYAKMYKNTIEKGLNFLSSKINDIDDLYSLAIIANVFQASKHEKASLVLDKLKSLAKTENDLQWWSGDSSDRISDIEITSYISMALLQTSGQYLPIAKWLLEQRNSHGGFKSTQDTVVGLQALIRFVQISDSQCNTLIKILYKAYDMQDEILVDGILGLDADNLQILQNIELPSATRSLELEVTGSGKIFLQFTYQYNRETRNVELLRSMVAHDLKNARSYLPKSFIIETKLGSPTNVLIMELEVCIVYKPLDDIAPINTNMVIAEIDLPSGYISSPDNIDELEQSDIVDRITTEIPDKIILYFAYLKNNEQKCVNIVAIKKDEVHNLQPSTVVVYDFYHWDRREIVTYKI